MSVAVAGQSTVDIVSRSVPTSLAARLRSTQWTPDRVSSFIARMPKVETHVHLDGTLSPKTIAALAAAQRYAPLMGKSEQDIRAVAVVTDPRESLGAVLKAFDVFYPLLHTPDAMQRISEDLLESASRQQTKYIEVRYAPALQATPTFSMESTLAAVLKGLEAGKRKWGVDSGVIICLYRPLSREQNAQLFELAAKYYGKGVVGLDLAGDEAKYPLSGFEEFYRKAKSAGMFTTVHAGEVPGSQDDLSLALRLRVNRIGHGALLASEPALIAEAARLRITVEANPTSNLRTGAIKRLADHPAKRLFDAGVPITVSTDDPGVFGNTLTDEYMILAKELGFSMPEIVAVDFQGIDALFASDAVKARLRAEFEREMIRLLDR
jgi:adenosine deaminase